ncbi:MAG: hypothetical protein ACKV2Q_06200 [Planctomycetaceae bacterium]
MSSLTLNERDHELLHALVRKVRVFTQRQIAEHWWQADLANARRRLKQLAEAGLVARVTVHARPLPELAQPVIVWRPGQPAPDCGRAAYELQRRWLGKALRSATAFIATQAAAQLLGGKHRGEIHQPTQVTHDLGVAAVWLRLHRTAPQWAEAWQSEDLLAHTRRDEKCPDAFLVQDGRIVAVIEFGGSYDAERVRAFHEDCVPRALPYQLW